MPTQRGDVRVLLCEPTLDVGRTLRGGHRKRVFHQHVDHVEAVRAHEQIDDLRRVGVQLRHRSAEDAIAVNCYADHESVRSMVRVTPVQIVLRALDGEVELVLRLVPECVRSIVEAIEGHDLTLEAGALPSEQASEAVSCSLERDAGCVLPPGRAQRDRNQAAERRGLPPHQHVVAQCRVLDALLADRRVVREPAQQHVVVVVAHRLAQRVAFLADAHELPVGVHALIGDIHRDPKLPAHSNAATDLERGGDHRPVVVHQRREVLMRP